MVVSKFLKRRHAFWARRSPRSRSVLKFVLVLVLVGVVVRSLPHLAPIRAVEIAQDDHAIEFSDRNGLPLGTLLTRDQNHTAVVALDQVSPQFIQAILAAEDQRFYHHGALDGRAIIRASLEAIQAREIVSGASTITMQLARMLEPNPRTAWNKAQEIWLSWRLAAGMSRDEILAAYINRLPMGGNVYGVEAASQVYFGTSAAHLTLAQASLLAALPNDPTDLNPYSHWLALTDRQRYILGRMVEDGYISQLQAERALQEAIALQPHSQGIIAAPHFLFWLADQRPRDPAPHIRTTLDRPLQQFVEAQVQQVVRSLAPHRARHAAALVLDNPSGEVLAYVGSPDYFADNESGRNDGVQALRQPGSTLKPFLYQLALEQRIIQPNTILADVPTYYPIPGARLYQPTDYSETFQGPVRVRVAIANSLNVPAVRVLEKVGVPTFLDRLHQLGFGHLDQPADYYGLGLSLGSGEVTLWELAHAYLTMARQGSPIPLQCQLSGAACEGERTNAQPSLPSPTSWALITDMLGDRHARAQSFGVDSVLTLPFPAAVKTGTSSDFRDTWTVGFTPDYTVATWVGNFDGSPMQQVSGVMGAAPLWNRIMLHLHEQQPPRQFIKPEGLVRRPICAQSGLKPTPACPAVVEEYLYPEDLVAYNQSNPQLDSAMEVSSSSAYTDHLHLPEDYNEWLAAQPSTGSSDHLRIVAPQEGDYFLIADPSQGEWGDSSQRLEFKLATVPTHPVEWWLNGEKLAVQSSRSLFWSPRPGQWTLEVKQGQRGDRIHFEVHLAEPSSPKRGFSVTQP
ncbi:MAG: penicillin-binding protein 1C [Elainellaceae cyanobacterium]